MRSLIFTCLLIAGCAVMNGAVKPTVPPGFPSPPTASVPAAKPSAPARYVLGVADEAMPDGWVRLRLGPPENGDIDAEFGHFPEEGYMRAVVFDGGMANEEAAAKSVADDLVASGAQVSPLDRENGDGHHASFRALVVKDGKREIRSFLFRPTGHGRLSLFIIGIWPLEHDAAVREGYRSIATGLALQPAQ